MNDLDQFTKHSNSRSDLGRKEPETSESRLQAKCVDDMQNYYPEHRGCFFAITNNSENRIKGAFNKALGVVPNVADTCWIDYHGITIWIEFKKPKGGYQRKGQQAWQELVEARGHEYVICRDYFHFWQIVGLPCPEPNYVFKN